MLQYHADSCCIFICIWQTSHESELQEDCLAFRTITAGCGVELASSGPCPDASEAMPCLLQRLKPDQLSTECAAAIAQAIPDQGPDTSLRATFWKDGKRKLSQDEVIGLAVVFVVWTGFICDVAVVMVLGSVSQQSAINVITTRLRMYAGGHS